MVVLFRGLSLFLLAASAAVPLTDAFGVAPPQWNGNVSIRSQSSATQLSLTAAEILAKARKAAGMPEDDGADEEYPKVFDEALYTDMQSALLKLERRVQDGPGALSALEVEELDGELQRVTDEMQRNGDVRPVKAGQQQQQQQQQPKQEQSAIDATTTTAAPTPSRSSSASLDKSNDEGPAYEGSGGMGQPKGTVNTYILDGMDEMTTEEYRQALDRSIVERQRARRRQGIVGNKSSWDYLNSISPGDTGPLRSDIYNSEDDNGDETSAEQ